jgi:hypothetical protein
MIFRKAKALLLGKGPHVRPPRLCLLGVLPLGVLAAGAEGWTYLQTLADGNPASTLLASQQYLGKPPQLRKALDLTWDWALSDTTTLSAASAELLAPTLPPPLCPSSEGALAETGVLAGELENGIRGLSSALAGGDRAATVAALQELDEIDATQLGEGGEFLLRYNLALGNAARGEYGEALRLLRPAFNGYVGEERIPKVSRESAGALLAGGRVTVDLATAAFHARLLAGLAAYGDRGEPDAAIGHFRWAINAVYFLLPPGGGVGWSERGHYQRVPVPAGSASCGGEVEVPLTSLDAYAGLVAAYLASPEFSERGRLGGEVARTSDEIRRSDPFFPVLLYAEQVAAGGQESRIPENYFWAVSNLQRVYHFNRNRSDPRLEVARAVLLLKLFEEDGWAGAVSQVHRFERCEVVGRVAGDLARDEELHGLGKERKSRTDSLRAVLAIRSYAQLRRQCGDSAAAEVDDSTRSRWIRTAGGRVAGGTAGFAESLRLQLRKGLEEESPDQVAAAFGTVDPTLSTLRWGRVPAEFPAGLKPGPVRDFLSEWRKAVFAETARQLVARQEKPGSDLGAAEVSPYLRTVNHAIGQAGLSPGEMYSAGRLRELAASQGRVSELRHRVVYSARNNPVATALVFILVLSVTIWVASLAYVKVWSYHLLVGTRFYAREARSPGRPRDKAA